jgi:hypothetical protein
LPGSRLAGDLAVVIHAFLGVPHREKLTVLDAESVQSVAPTNWMSPIVMAAFYR